MSIIVHKQDIVTKSINRLSRSRTPYIKMNKFKRMSSYKLRFRKRMPVHFAMKTRSTVNYIIMNSISRQT